MKSISPAEVQGNLRAPSSKSYSIRAVAAALLSGGKTRIINPSFCDDARAATGISASLGADISREGQDIILSLGRPVVRKARLDTGESGLCMRMFAPIVGTFNGDYVLEAQGTLLSRPMGMMEKVLQQLECKCSTNMGRSPVRIFGCLRGGKVSLEGAESSQFLTGLLMALPLCEHNSELYVSDLKSKPYIAMTLSILSEFGIIADSDEGFHHFSIEGRQQYKKTSYRVEGDWSGASTLLVAGAIAGHVTVKNLSQDSLQADRKILEALNLAGAKVTLGRDQVDVMRRDLNAFEFDASQCPDLFPALVVLATACRGRSAIFGVKRLYSKESNRAAVLMSEFNSLGAKIRIKEDRMIIEGRRLEGGRVNSHSDHRIAMAAAVAALVSKNKVIVSNPECVKKSYGNFFCDLDSVTRRKS